MIDVVLPVVNEHGALPGVLGAMPRGYRPIVVDAGPDDGAAELARELGATVVAAPHRGLGAACAAGLLAADADVVCFMDCDGSLDPRDLPRVADPVIEGRADMVLAARRLEPGALSAPARLANRALAFELRRRTGRPLTDLGPMRGARRRQLLALGLRDHHVGWPLEMVLRAADAGWRIEETRVPCRARRGRPEPAGTLRGTVRAMRDMRAAFAAAR